MSRRVVVPIGVHVDLTEFEKFDKRIFFKKCGDLDFARDGKSKEELKNLGSHKIFFYNRYTKTK